MPTEVEILNTLVDRRHKFNTPEYRKQHYGCERLESHGIAFPRTPRNENVRNILHAPK